MSTSPHTRELIREFQQWEIETNHRRMTKMETAIKNLREVERQTHARNYEREYQKTFRRIYNEVRREFPKMSRNSVYDEVYDRIPEAAE